LNIRVVVDVITNRCNLGHYSVSAWLTIEAAYIITHVIQDSEVVLNTNNVATCRSSADRCLVALGDKAAEFFYIQLYSKSSSGRWLSDMGTGCLILSYLRITSVAVIRCLMSRKDEGSSNMYTSASWQTVQQIAKRWSSPMCAHFICCTCIHMCVYVYLCDSMHVRMHICIFLFIYACECTRTTRESLHFAIENMIELEFFCKVLPLIALITLLQKFFKVSFALIL